MLPSDFFERNLVWAWTQLNRDLFGGALVVTPTFLITAMEHHAADWSASKNLIRFSRSFVEANPWLAVKEVLKHEMAHQYVSNILGIEDETSHGPGFQMVCERYGINGHASTRPRSEAEEHTVDKVKKLFSLGTSPNENEAKAALTKAHKLLEEYGLTEGDLHSPNADEHGVAHLGDVVLLKKPEDYRMFVSQILSRYFRVRNIWVPTFDSEGRQGLQLEICGRRSDLVITEHVHDFLHAEAQRLWERSNATRKRDKLDFFEGIMRGFLASLVTEEEALAAARSGSTPGLVRTAMEAKLNDYFERRNPNRGSVKGSKRSRGPMYGSGLAAGRKITLSTPLSGGGPKLLGAG